MNENQAQGQNVIARSLKPTTSKKTTMYLMLKALMEKQDIWTDKGKEKNFETLNSRRFDELS